MNKITILCVGKMKEEYFQKACDEYVKRLSRFARVEIKEIPEGKSLEAEGDIVLRSFKGYKVALCVEGEKLSSDVFAEKLKRAVDRGEELTFVIGSSCGLSSGVKSAADLRLSFSDMTFPHRLMRVILLEQIYRAFMINAGSEYHK